MSMDLTGITNVNEYYTNHYFSSIFEENAADTLSAWRAVAKEEGNQTPWSRLRDAARQYAIAYQQSQRLKPGAALQRLTREQAEILLAALGYPAAQPKSVVLEDETQAPVYLEVAKANGDPQLWVMLAQRDEEAAGAMDGHVFLPPPSEEENGKAMPAHPLDSEELAARVFFHNEAPPRWLMIITLDEVALLDRNKWNEKRFLRFDLSEIAARREETTFQAMAVLLHKDSLCPTEGSSLLDQMDETSHRHATAVSKDLKYALRESIELLGNEVLYDLKHRLGRDLDAQPVDAAALTLECMRYMYRMLFMLFIEARPELGYAPMKAQAYVQGYSLESLRDIVANLNEDSGQAWENGFFLYDTLQKLFRLIYEGYPSNPEQLRELQGRESISEVFLIEPLKAHIFDPELTPHLTQARLRNQVMKRVIDLMSVSRPTGRRGERPGRISYSALGINQMGAVYEALLSYRGFIAEHTLFEVKRKQDAFDELDVGYFVPENQLDQYDEDERVRYEEGEKKGQLRKYEKGTFIYRLAGREREKSASYYTPEVLTKCLVKYALKELLPGKTADEILQLTICEPAMGSAAFLNEAINQLAEAYLEAKQKELGQSIPHDQRAQELQKVKMYIADRNVYGIDLNPVAVELAEVSLWLNTIFEGGYVPWFGTQLVCGNSLIGARRQVYHKDQLTATGSKWYQKAPERVMPGDKRKPRTQIYHFLTGDEGMSDYKDRVIRSLAEEDITTIRSWRRAFTRPFSEDEAQSALRLSNIVDQLWDAQVLLRKELREKTLDPLTVYGQEEQTSDSHTTIRQKDAIYKALYLSENARNAGPYARLKFAMDYWCALWFWPIDQADLLPTRAEFLFDMSLILEGTIHAAGEKGVTLKGGHLQIGMFPSEVQQMAMDILDLYEGMGVVDLPALCRNQPRLALVKRIAEQNRFLHWELEFADLFEERGGFDLIVGNPPWVKLEWNEQGVLADNNPMFAIKNMNATQTTRQRATALQNPETYALYFAEFSQIAGSMAYYNASQNYHELKGQQSNLYKCFLPQSFMVAGSQGITALLHPDGVFDVPSGQLLRKEIYPRLRKHFQFMNMLKLFSEVHTNVVYSVNVYSNEFTSQFEMIANLYAVAAIDDCYDNTNNYPLIGIKDDNNNWSTTGHPDRLLHIGKKELLMFARLFDGNDDWQVAKITPIHSKELLETLELFNVQKKYLRDLGQQVFFSEMWHETNDQNAGIIRREVGFPSTPVDLVFSGPHIWVGNPFNKCPKDVCNVSSDYENIDLLFLPSNYWQRSVYKTGITPTQYKKIMTKSPWGAHYNQLHRLISRKMLNLSQERTLISAVIQQQAAHIHGMIGVAFQCNKQMWAMAAAFVSLPFDFYVKIYGKTNLVENTMRNFPLIPESPEILVRALILNCLTESYADEWKSQFQEALRSVEWSKEDKRLRNEHFANLSIEWSWSTPLRSDYARRQALVELDVLVAQALGMNLGQLKTIYRIQFPVLRKYEEDTWYDQNGRIVFSAKNMGNLIFSRPEWNNIKDMTHGTVTRTIIDDTQPGGPVERVIEYVAPFDRCDREQDYETAWAFFEEKYSMQE